MVGPKRASHDVWSGVGSKFLSSDAVNGSEREFHKRAECPPREAPFFRSARTSCTTSGGPVRPQETPKMTSTALQIIRGPIKCRG